MTRILWLCVVALALAGLASYSTAQTPPEDGHKRPWFCRDKDCPRYKTVGATSQRGVT